jgi:hypothetical protein
MKFKVGDTVRVIETQSLRVWPNWKEVVGKEGVVTGYVEYSFSYPSFPVYYLDNNKYRISFPEDCLVLVKEDKPMSEFKPGDKVEITKVLDKDAFHKVGDKGTVDNDLVLMDIVGKYALMKWYEWKKIEGDTMSKYEEFKQGIEALTCYDEKADGLLQELLKACKEDWNLTICNYKDGSGWVSISDPNYLIGMKMISWNPEPRCDAFKAIKKGLLWLLDHSNFKKDEKQERIDQLQKQVDDFRKQADELQRQVEELK